MAATTGRLFKDPDLNADFIGQRKFKGVGRKPLGDLSNTGKPINLGKPSVTKPSKQLQSQNLTGIVIDEAVSAKTSKASEKSRTGGSRKAFSDISNSPSVSKSSKTHKSQNLNAVMNDAAVSAKAKNLEGANKASDKLRTGSRKALSDISNSVKAHIPEIKNKNILKPPSSLREEPFDLDAIAEEGFLHNHQKCIEAESSGAMDVLHFFKTLGLENGSDDDLKISFELPAITKLKSESSHLELEEVPEHVLEEEPLFSQPNSPGHCDSPKSSSYAMWDDYAANLKLIDSPTKIV